MKKKNKIKIPKTKKQKIRIKHIWLLGLVVVLGAVFVSLFFLKKDKLDEDDNNKVIPNEEVIIEDENKLEVYDETSNQRPIAVMIPNDSQAKKRHHGLSKAYLIYEITVEGGITRLLAVFKDVDVSQIGPVRSSRHYYLDYALENDAIYVHFGWSPQAEKDIKSLGINNLNGLYNPSNMFWRDKSFNSPNNAFTSTANVIKAATSKKYRTTSDNYKLFNYEKEVDLTQDATYQVANQVKIDYTNSTYVKYVYDSENKYYLRYNNENAHMDLLTNEQLHFKNILVVKANTTTISGDEKGRQDLKNLGTGEGYFITNGQSIKITWTKESRNSKTIYKDLNGNEIKLTDGNTFVQIQPVNKSVTIE